ncbi:GNAT family N-acetyltransferase [Rossellomorea vietnamensis]|uniref:GNAT family N-acetyltransferase n=1 Tax=Rossellomorea vietnamensis TaxID=218284 RepID=UPI001CCE72C5|nr:GNAT family N-acetyltransferase [Rossellomorea vietnamensis]MCA0149641.1 GNAT family N-acetyltransferase [Rossellomorea vietnamensis]
MIHIQKANRSHVQGIKKVCSEVNRATYRDIYTKEYIERVIEEFYNEERILKEVTSLDRHWGGYYVALENDEVIGAGGGGMISETEGELYVLYLDPTRRNEGIGTLLLEAITQQQKEEFHASKQWVSVQEGNEKGIPFYEARGFVYENAQLGYGNEGEEDYRSLRYSRFI